MTVDVPQYLRQRLNAVINDLKITVGREAAKAYLTERTTVELREFAPGAEICDDSWMEYINEDYVTDASALQKTRSPTEANVYCSVSSQTDNPSSPIESIAKGDRKAYKERKEHRKKERSRLNTLDTVVQDIPRSDLLAYLYTY